MTMDHFGFTKLIVADLERSAKFYKTVCELSELARVDAAIEGRPISEILFNATGEGAATFVLLSYADAPDPKGGEVIIGFVTKDVGGFVARAQAAGGSIAQEVVSQPQHGVKVAFVRDVEGHLIEVVELLPQ